jgi:hypothetical protein
VVGQTFSTDFPTLNAYCSVHTNDSVWVDIFISKFSPDGELLWSTFFGGNDHEVVWDLFIDPFDNILICGRTSSSDFPTTSNAFQRFYSGNEGDGLDADEGYVAKFSSEGSLLWSTYLGTTLHDSISGVTVDSQNNVVVAGRTKSANFPILNANDSTFNGQNDAFIAKLSSNGSSLLWSTYLGEDDIDSCRDVIVNSNDEVIVLGETFSDSFPGPIVYESPNFGGVGIFLTKFTSNGTKRLWTALFGSSGLDYPRTLLIDPHDEHLIVTGFTWYNDFPTLHAYDDTFAGLDTFISEFDPNGSLLWSTYLGGSNADGGLFSSDLTPSGQVIVTGSTSSADFPITTDVTHTGSTDVFVTILNDPLDSRDDPLENDNSSVSIVMIVFFALSISLFFILVIFLIIKKRDKN